MTGAVSMHARTCARMHPESTKDTSQRESRGRRGLHVAGVGVGVGRAFKDYHAEGSWVGVRVSAVLRSVCLPLRVRPCVCPVPELRFVRTVAANKAE